MKGVGKQRGGRAVCNTILNEYHVVKVIFVDTKVDVVKNETHADGGDHGQHGPSSDHGSGHRHVHKSSALCGGEWKYPVSCDPFEMDCTYYAKWEYLEYSDQIRFTITANHTNRWVYNRRWS